MIFLPYNIPLLDNGAVFGTDPAGFYHSRQRNCAATRDVSAAPYRLLVLHGSGKMPLSTIISEAFIAAFDTTLPVFIFIFFYICIKVTLPKSSRTLSGLSCEIIAFPWRRSCSYLIYNFGALQGSELVAELTHSSQEGLFPRYFNVITGNWGELIGA